MAHGGDGDWHSALDHLHIYQDQAGGEHGAARGTAGVQAAPRRARQQPD